MKIVIDISEENYMSCQTSGYAKKSIYVDLVYAIRKGIILPKGHGKLIDADVVDNNIYDLARGMDLNYEQISEVVDNAPTIIEADNKESD